ncbi:dna repair protein, partial [Lasius niger]
MKKRNYAMKFIRYDVESHRDLRDVSDYGADGINNVFGNTGCAPVSSMKAIGPLKEGDS